MTRIAPAPIGPLTAAVAGLAALTQGALVVVGLWLFVGVFLLVGVEEILGSLPSEVDLAARASIIGLAAIGALGGAGEAARVALERALRLRTAQRLAAAGAPMPPAAERAQLVRGTVRTLRILCGVLAGVAGLVAFVLGGAGLSEEDGGLLGAGGVALALVALLVVALLALRPASRWWADAIGDLRAAWPQFADSDEPRASQASDGRLRGTARVDRVLGAAVGIAFVVVVVGVLLRQQCRSCDPVSYDPWGESVVDGVATVGVVLFAGSLALVALRGLWWLVAQGVREARAAASARSGDLRRSAWLDGALTTPRSLELAARLLGVVAMALVSLVVSSVVDADLMSADEQGMTIVRSWSSLAPAAAVAAAVALALGIAGVVVARRWRSVILSDVRGDPFPASLERR